MTRVQVLILAGLFITVLGVFCIAAVVVRLVLLSPAGPEVAEQPPTATPAVPPSDTPTLIPTSTATLVPTVPGTPTATNTRVVLDTATPTPTETPTITPTPTETGTPTRAPRGGGGSSGTQSTPTPTSRYPLRILEGPLTYKTHNHFLVILAQVTSGNTYLPGYRLIAIRTPSGITYKGPPSCNRICKANGPEGSIIQRGNMVLETPYEKGPWSVMVVDPQGRQVSDIIEFDLSKMEDLWWFYYRFGR